jgi:hypothetical protein
MQIYIAEKNGYPYRIRRGNMHSEDLNILLLLVACGVSVWLTVLFVRLCGRVKAIKAILMAAYDLQEYKVYGGVVYRKK